MTLDKAIEFVKRNRSERFDAAFVKMIDRKMRDGHSKADAYALTCDEFAKRSEFAA